MAEVSYPDVIQYMKISQELAAKAIARSAMLGGGSVDKRLAQMLYTERKSIAWLYEQDPTNSTLRKTANYGLSLCGQYLFEAMQIAGDGGVVINPNTPSGATRAVPYRLQFIIGESDSPMIAGQTSLTIGITNVQADSVQLFLDGSIKMRGTEMDEVRYTLTATTLYITILFNQAVNTGQKYIIHALRNISSGSSSGTSSNASLVYQEHTSGATVTINDTTDVLVINPASTLAALAITMPATPVKDKVIRIIGGGSLTQGNVVVSVLTISGNTGQSILQSINPTQLFSGEAIEYLVYTLTQYRRI